MKYSFLIFLVYLVGCGTAPKSVTSKHEIEIPADSLKKYSYFITGFKLPNNPELPIRFTGGTGFFINRNDTLYFITAKHVLTGCDGKRKGINLPRTVNIWSPNIQMVMELDIGKIQDTANCDEFEKDIDVIAVPVPNKEKYSVNSIDNYLLPAFEVVNSTDIYGYPFTENAKSATGFRIVPPSHISLKKNQHYYYPNFYNKTNIVDSANWRIYADSLKFDPSLEGYSGSPVFAQDSISKKWRIVGLLKGFGRQLDNVSFGYVPLLENALQNIDSRKH